MNENYLWDRSESDAEIEKLEAALRVYRGEQTAAPKLPAKVLPFKPKTAGRRIFPAMLKIAACLAVGAFALAAWMQIYKMNLNVEQAVSETSRPKNETAAPGNFHSNESAAPPENLTANADQKNIHPERRVYKIRHKTVSANLRRPESKKIKQVVSKPPVRLTKEEKHAYDQLMLALAITSSNLKAVKDKAEGLE